MHTSSVVPNLFSTRGTGFEKDNFFTDQGWGEEKCATCSPPGVWPDSGSWPRGGGSLV